MRYFLSVFVFACSILSSAENSLLKQFPSSTEEVASFTSCALQNFDRQFLEFAQQPLSSLNYENVVTKWAKVVDPLFTKGVILSCLPLTTQNEEMIKKAEHETKLLQEKLILAMQDPKALSLFLHFVKSPMNQKEMSPYEIYTVDLILNSIKNNSLKEEILSIQKALSQYKSQPYLYSKGKALEKQLLKNNELTLLSWNVCLLQNNISMLFGGVLPWKQRINLITNKIQELDADVVCLQEVFSPDASDHLIKNLISNYAYFYYNMGPNPAGFSVTSLGIPSGLFVASKYPLKEETFISYDSNQTPSFRNYGFFKANICIGEKAIAQIVTTHLQPGSSEADKKYRDLQTKAILANLLDSSTPTFLCGDFNILKDSEEAKKLFSLYKESNYEGLDWTCCELRDYWWKSKQNAENFKALPPEKEWLDYVFYLKGSSKNTPHLSSKVIVVNDLTFPDKALSDHQILFTTLTLTE